MPSAWHSRQLQTRIFNVSRISSTETSKSIYRFIISNLANLLPTFRFLIQLEDIITTQIPGPASFWPHSSCHLALQPATTRMVILRHRSLWASLLTLINRARHRNHMELLWRSEIIYNIGPQCLTHSRHSACVCFFYPFSFPSCPPPPDCEPPEDRVCIFFTFYAEELFNESQNLCNRDLKYADLLSLYLRIISATSLSDFCVPTVRKCKEVQL